jgi:hypothetical protein
MELIEDDLGMRKVFRRALDIGWLMSMAMAWIWARITSMLAQGLSKGTERFGTAPFDHPAATPRRRNPARWSRNGAPAERWHHRRRFGVPRSTRAVPGLAQRSEGTREIRVILYAKEPSDGSSS